MRTTLDLDERVVVAARARARSEGSTVGAVVSALALKGMAADSRPGAVRTHGLVLLPIDADHRVTDAMVAEALDDA